ncbi:MAG TPA: PEP-CTERM sorting domain-containing protein [Lacipirellulaceae bacterium]|nr:PEP-CTERM sorting domain-containing protein [Lacipirellulaceae bacterium]
MSMTRYVMAVLLCAALAPARGRALTIDDFSVGPMSLATLSSTVQQTLAGLDPLHVLGGSRFASVGIVSAGALTVGTRFELAVDQQRLTFASDPAGYGYLTLTYGRDAPLNADLTADGVDRFVLDVLAVHAGGSAATSLNLIVVTGAPGDPARNGSGAFQLAHATPGRYALPFGSLSAQAGFDLAHVRSITIERGRFFPGSEVVLGGLSTVPEPASGASALAAGAALATLRRRRRR